MYKVACTKWHRRAHRVGIAKSANWQKVAPGPGKEQLQNTKIQNNAKHYNTMSHNATQYNTLQYNALKCKTLQYNVTQCNTMQYHPRAQGRSQPWASGVAKRHLLLLFLLCCWSYSAANVLLLILLCCCSFYIIHTDTIFDNFRTVFSSTCHTVNQSLLAPVIQSHL